MAIRQPVQQVVTKHDETVKKQVSELSSSSDVGSKEKKGIGRFLNKLLHPGKEHKTAAVASEMPAGNDNDSDIESDYDDSSLSSFATDITL